MYLVAFPITMYLTYITLKYGLMPKKNFIQMFDRGSEKKESFEYVAPMLVRTGMEKSSKESLKVYVRQLDNVVAKMPKVKNDFLVMPLGYTRIESLNSEKEIITKVVHNRETFSFNQRRIAG